jgi:TPR repeat protein
MYLNGRGVLRDYKEAMQWFRLAAENGYVPAQSRLGDMYQNGLGVPKNYVFAQMWKNIAAANAPTGELKQLKQLTLQQIVEAQELARKCTANKFKGC